MYAIRSYYAGRQPLPLHGVYSATKAFDLLFGEAVEMIEPYRWGWSYISHFIHARFYCYSYVFGELLVLALYQKYREEGGTFVPRYLELLAQGGSRKPSELLAPLGIDLADPDFWQKGYDFVRGLLQELRELVEQG